MSPKLPDTTNLVLTSKVNEYKEIKAMKISTKLENKMPPLKKLNGTSQPEMGHCH